MTAASIISGNSNGITPDMRKATQMDASIIGLGLIAALLTLLIYTPIAFWLHPRLEAIIDNWRDR